MNSGNEGDTRSVHQDSWEPPKQFLGIFKDIPMIVQKDSGDIFLW